MYLTEDENNTGSCGIMEIFDLRSFNLTLAVSISSISIVPSTGASLNIADIKVDFPAPVLPTMPI